MMAMNEEERRDLADRQIEQLTKYARAMEAEGDYREAQSASDEAAKWEFWAIYGNEK